jgi:AcrR family transcriptional regulator
MGTRRYIIKTALGLFISKSYKAVTMSDLEKATGLTKGAFYHHFKNKEELFVEVIDTYYLSKDFFDNKDLLNYGTLKQNFEYLLNQIEVEVERLKEFTKKEIVDPYLFLLIIEAREYYPDFIQKANEKEMCLFRKWEQIILRSKENTEIRRDLDTTILVQNIIAIESSLMKSFFKEKPLDYSLSILKLQIDQFYSLIKV